MQWETNVLKPPAEWRLTPTETNVLDALLAWGRIKRAALSLGMGYSTAKCHCLRIRHKAGVDNILQAAVAWDRYTRQVAA